MSNDSDKYSIRQSLANKLPELRENTTVIEHSDLLDFGKTEEGVLIVYAAWSGPAIMNSLATVGLLYEQNYTGQIMVIDTDSMSPDFQINLFGQVCHGYGEIFLIRNGSISKKYLGPNSYINFKGFFI